MMVNPKILKFLIIVSLSISYAGYCQGTLEDYQRAEAIDTLYRNKVFNNPSEFHWLNDKEFWYRNNAETGTQYILVNAESKTKKLFDHSLMAGNLSAALQKNINEKEMDLSEFKIEENQLIFQNDSLKFKMDLQSKQVLVTDTIKRERRSREYWGRRNREDEGKPVLSPDGRYEAFIKKCQCVYQAARLGRRISAELRWK